MARRYTRHSTRFRTSSKVRVNFTPYDLTKAIKDAIQKDFDGLGSNSKPMIEFRKLFGDYWHNNVYDVFNARDSLNKRNTGQLGDPKNLIIKKQKNKLTFSLKNLKHSGSWTESGGKTSDYGKYLINGSRSSSGRYSSNLDRKLEGGSTSGVSPGIWKKWEENYEPKIPEFITEVMIRNWMRKAGVRPKRLK